MFAVIKLDGSTPVRYGLRLNMDEKYTGLKKQLSELCSLKPEQILLAEVHTSNIKVQHHTAGLVLNTSRAGSKIMFRVLQHIKISD